MRVNSGWPVIGLTITRTQANKNVKWSVFLPNPEQFSCHSFSLLCDVKKSIMEFHYRAVPFSYSSADLINTSPRVSLCLPYLSSNFGGQHVVRFDKQFELIVIVYYYDCIVECFLH